MKQSYRVKIGQDYWFEYHCLEAHHSQDAQLWYRSHQRVKVVKMEEPGIGKDEDTRIEVEGCPAAFKVKFADGFTGTAMEDELLDSRDHFTRPDPPRPRAESIVRALLDSDDELMAELGNVAADPIYAIRQALISGGDETIKVPLGTGRGDMSIQVQSSQENPSSKLRHIRVRWPKEKYYGGPTEESGGSGAYMADQAGKIADALEKLIVAAKTSKNSYTDYPVDQAYRNLISLTWTPKNPRRGYRSHHFWSDLGQWPPRRRR